MAAPSSPVSDAWLDTQPDFVHLIDRDLEDAADDDEVDSFRFFAGLLLPTALFAVIAAAALIVGGLP